MTKKRTDKPRLQARERVHHIDVSLDEKAADFLEGIQAFAKDSLKMEVTKAIVVRRALAVYFANLMLRIKKAKNSKNPQESIDKLIRTEQELLKFSANRYDFSSEDVHLTEDEIKKMLDQLNDTKPWSDANKKAKVIKFRRSGR